MVIIKLVIDATLTTMQLATTNEVVWSKKKICYFSLTLIENAWFLNMIYKKFYMIPS